MLPPTRIVRATGYEVIGVPFPVLLPANGPTADIETLLDRLDGIVLTGSRSNVQPTLYDGPPHAEGTPEDPARDGITLPLIRAAVARGVPLLAICRGFQEMNVAFGGSLHQRLQDLPDRMDHSAPMQPSTRVRQAKAHAIRVTPGGWLHRLAGTTEIAGQFAPQSGHQSACSRASCGRHRTSGWHGRGSARIAATQAGTAIGYMLSACSGIPNMMVLWQTDPLSKAIFEQFGAAVRAYADAARLGGVSIAAD